MALQKCLSCGKKFDWKEKRFCPSCEWDTENFQEPWVKGVADHFSLNLNSADKEEDN